MKLTCYKTVLEMILLKKKTKKTPRLSDQQQFRSFIYNILKINENL